MLIAIITIIAAAVVLIALFGLVNKNEPTLDKTPFRESWRIILQKAGNQETWEIAIINADKLLDVALKRRKFVGETMGERLISAKGTLSKRQQVWEAHKLRNRLVHEEKVHLDQKKVNQALKGFESALKDVDVL